MGGRVGGGGRVLHISANLVVRHCVAHARLGVAAIGQGVYNVAHIPVIVVNLGEDLNPLVCDCHLQPVVKAHTTLRDRPVL